MDLATVETGLVNHLPPAIVKEILTTYQDLKRCFFLGHLRPNEVEGGRFSEAVFRALEHVGFGAYTPIGQQLNTDDIIRRLSQLPSASHNDSIRLHIPRTLRVIYDIRNRRDAAHLADGIDPNLQDASLVCSCCDWILAELVRLYHTVSASEAHTIVENLVTRQAPSIQDFNGELKTLRPSLKVSDRILLLLYHRGTQGATEKELASWLHPDQRANLKRTLAQLVNDKDFLFSHGDRYEITRLGQIETERKNLLVIT